MLLVLYRAWGMHEDLNNAARSSGDLPLTGAPGMNRRRVAWRGINKTRIAEASL
jgi:hypothetical protein